MNLSNTQLFRGLEEAEITAVMKKILNGLKSLGAELRQ